MESADYPLVHNPIVSSLVAEVASAETATTRFTIWTMQEYPETEPTYAMVQLHRVGGEGFTVEGIFTRDQDALDFMEEMSTKSWAHSNSIMCQRLPLSTIVRILIKDKLGEIAVALGELVGRI